MVVYLGRHERFGIWLLPFVISSLSRIQLLTYLQPPVTCGEKHIVS